MFDEKLNEWLKESISGGGNSSYKSSESKNVYDELNEKLKGKSSCSEVSLENNGGDENRKGTEQEVGGSRCR